MSRIRKRKKMAKEIIAEMGRSKVTPPQYFTEEMVKETDPERSIVLNLLAQHYIEYARKMDAELMAKKPEVKEVPESEVKE